MADWYGAEDEWPRHPESWWREALPKAQQAGWWLEKYVGTSKHRWAKLKCRRTDDRDDAVCTIRVDSSGKGAENVARDVPKKIKNCPHRSEDLDSPDAALQRARERLDDARALLEAVERLLEQRGAVAHARELFLDALEAGDEVERLVDAAMGSESSAADDLAIAEEELALVSGGSADPVDGLTAVDGVLDRAQDALTSIPPKIKEARAVRADLDRLRDRAATLRGRIMQ